eukprot:1981621-Amphidinium_carterae.1
MEVISLAFAFLWPVMPIAPCALAVLAAIAVLAVFSTPASSQHYSLFCSLHATRSHTSHLRSEKLL